MKLLNWMQNKFNGKQGIKKAKPISVNHHKLQEPLKEEFSDWPHGLLAIGTFGNNNWKEDSDRHINLQGNASSYSSQDLTPEEVIKLEKELKLLLHKQDGSIELESINLPFIDIVVDDDELVEKDGHLQRSGGVVLNRGGKDVCLDNNKNAIGKRSVSFLLKKMFVCGGGFAPTPSLRDQLPELRMEKILRAILHKKVYPQNSSSTLSKKKYLENRYKPKSDNQDELKQKEDQGSKWVKTDSEYIVLEI